MKVELQIDGMYVAITTRDPETLARWLGEMFTAFRPSPATHIDVRVYPWFVDNAGQPPALDWIADTRITTYMDPVRTPQEFVSALQAQVDQYEKRDA